MNGLCSHLLDFDFDKCFQSMKVYEERRLILISCSGARIAINSNWNVVVASGGIMYLYHTPLKFLTMGFNGEAIRCTHSCKNPYHTSGKSVSYVWKSRIIRLEKPYHTSGTWRMARRLAL